MILKVFLLLSGITSFAMSNDTKNTVVTVPELNIEQYLGKWHQIAAIPAFFQKECVRNTTAVYSKSENNLISVENRCEKQDGQISEAIGVARVNPELQSASKLQVTFVKLFGQWVWAFGGNYWVMELGEDDGDYAYSVVGDPTREYLWILARKPELTFEEIAILRDKIAGQSYDLDKIIVTQSGELYGKKLSDLGT